ncbi:hypothetical protein D021_0128A, partial [Vibrio parahaemolyticus 10296]
MDLATRSTSCSKCFATTAF